MKNQIRSLIIALSFLSAISASAQVPLLNSYAPASAVIFLDFDGHTVSSTSWNYSGPIYCGASGLNNTQITEIFNRIAEDYRPFNINITTDSTKYWAAPATKRVRIVLTDSSSWYGSAGGVSFVGSFLWGDNTPGFVFTALLGHNPKYIADAASHEAGHTLGLYHQALYNTSCGLVTQYNSGIGSGETGWAPLMGIGYYKNTTTWYNGPNPYGCSAYQDDLGIILGNNGLTYRTDDFGDVFASATNESFVDSQFTVNGIISTPTDKDMFKFTLPYLKHFKVNAVPNNVGAGDAGSNLDISVKLFNSSLDSLNYYNPPSALNVAVDTVLNAGTYYMLIDAVGNDYTPKYGSLGSYAVVVAESPVIILPLKELKLQGSINGDMHQFNWFIDADEEITDQELEISTDGKNFSSVMHATDNTRSYSYKPTVNSTALYRLKVSFVNVGQFYSNIVTLPAVGSSQRPRLISNFINTGSITVSSPGNYSYAIYDFTGKTIIKGQLTNGANNIAASGMTSGIYMISFGNSSKQWTDKLIKQ